MLPINARWPVSASAHQLPSVGVNVTLLSDKISLGVRTGYFYPAGQRSCVKDGLPDRSEFVTERVNAT